MKGLSKKFVFYFVIMEENKSDHLLLRKLIHSLVPQAMVESIYDFNEAIIYFKENKLKPHILFLTESMSKAGLSIGSDGTLSNLKLEEQALVFLSSTKAQRFSEQNIYKKPFDKNNFLNLLGSLNRNWLL